MTASIHKFPKKYDIADERKTFQLPAATLAKWLAALRSGKYEQGKGALKTGDGKYCCLGVLQMAVDGKVEKRHRGPALPSNKWCCDNGMMDSSGSVTARNPKLPYINRGMSCAEYNDSGVSFVEIADAIEKACVPT